MVDYTAFILSDLCIARINILITMYDYFCILLNAICQYFVEGFCIHPHESLVSSCLLVLSFSSLVIRIASYNELKSVPFSDIYWKRFIGNNVCEP